MSSQQNFTDGPSKPDDMPLKSSKTDIKMPESELSYQLKTQFERDLLLEILEYRSFQTCIRKGMSGREVLKEWENKWNHLCNDVPIPCPHMKRYVGSAGVLRIGLKFEYVIIDGVVLSGTSDVEGWLWYQCVPIESSGGFNFQSRELRVTKVSSDPLSPYRCHYRPICNARILNGNRPRVAFQFDMVSPILTYRECSHDGYQNDVWVVPKFSDDPDWVATAFTEEPCLDYEWYEAQTRLMHGLLRQSLHDPFLHGSSYKYFEGEDLPCEVTWDDVKMRKVESGDSEWFNSAIGVFTHHKIMGYKGLHFIPEMTSDELVSVFSPKMLPYTGCGYNGTILKYTAHEKVIVPYSSDTNTSGAYILNGRGVVWGTNETDSYLAFSDEKSESQGYGAMFALRMISSKITEITCRKNVYHPITWAQEVYGGQNWKARFDGVLDFEVPIISYVLPEGGDDEIDGEDEIDGDPAVFIDYLSGSTISYDAYAMLSEPLQVMSMSGGIEMCSTIDPGAKKVSKGVGKEVFDTPIWPEIMHLILHDHTILNRPGCQIYLNDMLLPSVMNRDKTQHYLAGRKIKNDAIVMWGYNKPTKLLLQHPLLMFPPIRGVSVVCQDESFYFYLWVEKWAKIASMAMWFGCHLKYQHLPVCPALTRNEQPSVVDIICAWLKELTQNPEARTPSSAVALASFAASAKV